MLDVNVLIQDVQTLINNNDPDAPTLIAMTSSVYLQELPLDVITKAFNQHDIVTTVGSHHLFLSIDGVKLRIPLRPLFQGDNHATSNASKRTH